MGLDRPKSKTAILILCLVIALPYWTHAAPNEKETVQGCLGDCTEIVGTDDSDDFSAVESPKKTTKSPKGTNIHKKKGAGDDEGTLCLGGCWVMERTYPARECKCMNDTSACLGADIAIAEICSICDRGYGVFETREECEMPPGADVEIAEDSIDPSSYPSPYVPESKCSSKHRAKTTHRECPHMEQNLAKWEDPWTWGSGSESGWVPTRGTWVTLPEWKKVLVSSCSVKATDTYAAITIPETSELIFDDEEIHMSVGTIYVHGKLRIGSKHCRVHSNIALSFNYVNDKGVKFEDLGIVVEKSGQLDIHGKYYNPTWTRLKETARAGSNKVKLQKKVDWVPGQLAVVTTTIWKDETNNQNEVLRIRGVSSDRKTVYFQKTLKFNHYGESEYQAEVGLLSRNIVLQGNAKTAKKEKGPGIRVKGQARISGMTAYRMGQKNVLGSYPIHFHLIGYAPHSYVTDSVVYKSYYRGFVVHGTNNVLVKGNVAFDVIGHCYYLEDGVEELNWFEDNLAAFVHVIGKPAAGIFQEGENFVESKHLAQPADSTASGFYITNAYNTFKNNAASGGYSGFAFPQLPAPIGDHVSLKHFKPHQRPTLVFDGNTAHSSGYYWFRGSCIYFGGKLWKKDGKLHYNSGRHARDTKDNDNNPAFTVLTNTKVFLCNRGINHWGSRVEVHNYEAWEVTRGATLFGEALLQNARISLKTKNYWSQFPGNLYDILPIAGFQWYDDSVRTIITDTTFEGYRWLPANGNQRQAVFITMYHSDEFKPSGISATRNISYVDVDYRAILWSVRKPTGSSRYFNWVDHDGSSVMKNQPMIIGSYDKWWWLGDDCSWKNDWNAWLCEKTPGREIARLDVRVPWFTKPVKSSSAVPATKENEIGYIAQFGHKSKARKMTITKNEGITGVTGDTGWYIHFWKGVPAELEIFLIQVPKGSSMIFATRFPENTQFKIEKRFKWHSHNNKHFRWVKSVDEVQKSTDDTFHFNGQHLYIKVFDTGDSNYPAPFVRNGVTLYGNRWFDLSIKVTTNLNCPSKDGGPFCPMGKDDIPGPLPDHVVVEASDCPDIPPDSEHTCTQQKGYGKCNARWFKDGGFCQRTCGKCSRCTDFAPYDDLRCHKTKSRGRCEKQWVKDKGLCQMTCGRCPWYKPRNYKAGGQNKPKPHSKAHAQKCTDVRPPGPYACWQHKGWGKCGYDWMIRGNFCRKSCGKCGFSAAEDEPAFSNIFFGDGTIFEDETDPLRPVVDPVGRPSNSSEADFGVSAGSMWDFEIAAQNVEKSVRNAYCQDVPPPGRLTCPQQKAWGVCNEPWMKENGWCSMTCGRCLFLSSCADIPTPDGVKCQEHLKKANCDDAYLLAGGYCEKTCNRCPQQLLTEALAKAGIETKLEILPQQECTDRPPPGTMTCTALHRQGRCTDAKVVDGNYCNKTCTRC